MLRITTPILAITLAGCAQTISLEKLQASTSNKSIVFANGFSYDISNDWDLPKPEPGSIRGLLPGTYYAEFEDANGTYYRGIGTCVIWNSSPLNHKKRYLAEGGVWLEKNSTAPKFRLYRVLALHTETSIAFDDSPGVENPCGKRSPASGQQGETSSGSSTVIANSNVALAAKPAIVPGALGGALGYAIVQAIASTDQGKLALLPPPPKGVQIAGAFQVVEP